MDDQNLLVTQIAQNHLKDIYIYIYIYIYSFGGNFYFYRRETFTNTSNTFTQQKLRMSTTPESTCIIILTSWLVIPLRLSNFYSVSLADIFQTEFSPNWEICEVPFDDLSCVLQKEKKPQLENSNCNNVEEIWSSVIDVTLQRLQYIS